MDIRRAVEILNGREHQGFTDWFKSDVGLVEPRCLGGEGRTRHLHTLDKFEAIAIAEKYARESSGDEAAPAKTVEALETARAALNDALAGVVSGRDLPATRKIAPVYRRFLERVDEAHVPDGLPLFQNEAGSVTLADLKAAVAEWEGL